MHLVFSGRIERVDHWSVWLVNYKKGRVWPVTNCKRRGKETGLTLIYHILYEYVCNVLCVLWKGFLLYLSLSDSALYLGLW